MADKDLKRTLLSKYNKLAKLIGNYNYFSLTDFKIEQFQPTLIAAFVKCFEFNCDMNRARSSENAFYNLSFLRGICEDLISLAFIEKLHPTDRNELIIAYNQYLLLSSIKAQTEFLKTVKPFQPIVNYQVVGLKLEDAEKALKDFWGTRGHNRNKIFPGVEHMAIDTKLKPVYDYLYHATSKTVHFSPNILLRLGWYKSKDDPIVFSVKNFNRYYDVFNCYYGSYLFIEFYSRFKKQLKLDQSFAQIVNEIKAVLDDVDYFPELVTFEELNVKRPNKLPYKILELASKMEKAEREMFVKHLPEILQEVKARADKRSSNPDKKGQLR